ncbi:MAG: choice-of-anchor D domain-containing protein [Verrucomicrobiae bacterium]|nr:choice-of-anchor D domain-containing protein [Verrucomicrobiae bacterium]
MNTHPRFACLAIALLAPPASASAESGGAIPFSEIGARAGADYKGDALGIRPVPGGARLHCAFQKLEGHATPEGLWLASTEDGSRLRLIATEVGRGDSSSSESLTLAPSGQIHIAENIVSFVRSGLKEEYSVSVDGLRQDFIVAERPPGEGELRVELGLTGARARAVAPGAILTLDGSGRELAYSRLRVLDARGRELPARIDTLSDDRLAILVCDAGAAYPVRIDPTFSDAEWSSLGAVTAVSGANGDITAAAVVGGDVYVGGSFTAIGNTPARNIARWNGSSWFPLGTVAQNGADGTISAIAAPATNAVYVGGTFTNLADASTSFIAARNVALWNGAAWSRLGTPTQNGAGNSVYAIAAPATNAVYIGGTFTSVADASSASISARYAALWNGAAWSPLGTPIQNGAGSFVNAIAAPATNAIYVGGSFTNVADASTNFISANRIALWNGAAWSRLGTPTQNGANNSVYAIAAPATNALYIGGLFTNVADASSPSLSANRIALWNGAAWSRLGTPTQNGANNSVYDIAAPATNAVYIGGDFTSVADASSASISANRIAFWNGAAWSRLGTAAQNGANSSVRAIAALSTSAVYVGGNFSSIADASSGSILAKRIAMWDATTNRWIQTPAHDGGANDDVNALAMAGADLYVGGAFTRIGNTNANRIARWDGSAWSPLGTPAQNGVNNTVWAIAAAASNAIYVGGAFSTAADASSASISTRRIGLWNGAAWSPLGSATQNGADTEVYAIAAAATNAIYVGGSFTNVADASSASISANRIALWNGAAWSPLGSATQNGADSFVMAIAAPATNAIYLGGWFTTVADASSASISANRIGLWNGSSWSRLGTPTQNGVNNPVSAIAALSTNEIYVGGDFTSAADASTSAISVKRVARWDAPTSRWAPLGGGVDDSVNALATDGSARLFAGGQFLSAGANPVTIASFVAEANIHGPDISIERPAGFEIADGGAGSFGNVLVGTNTTLSFTIRNLGETPLSDPSNLTNLFSITVDGPHAADFTVTAFASSPIAPGNSNSFTVTISPITSGAKTAAVHIANNDSGENPYDITLTASALAFDADTDGDGLSDGSELQLAELGFDPASNQASRVSALFANLGGALSNLNAEGYFSGQQIRDSLAPYPLIQRNETNRLFTLTIAVEKSSNLVHFAPFPMSAPQITNMPSGEVEFRFFLPDGRAFFHLRPQ